jgi:hypothetical protein
MTTPPADESAEAPSPPPPAAPSTGAPAPDHTYAFAPVTRAPRVPWVNPARRAHVVGVAAASALVLLGAGIGIGWAAGGDGPGGHGGYPMQLRPAYYPGGPGAPGLPGRGRLKHQFPLPGQLPTAATPSPTSTK